MRHELNLAGKPFLNPRPVLRVTLLLWLVGLGVAAFNVRLYFSHYSGSSSDRERETELQSTLEAERGAVQALEDELRGYDVGWQNQQSTYLNAKIAERSFSWSKLFDRLGEAMPAQVRLNSLIPTFNDGKGSKAEIFEGEAQLGIRGQARSSEVLLEFVDSLFAHPSFRAPNLSSEKLMETGLLDFGLTVIYAASEPVDPEAAVADPEATTAEPPAGEPMEAEADATEGETVEAVGSESEGSTGGDDAPPVDGAAVPE